MKISVSFLKNKTDVRDTLENLDIDKPIINLNNIEEIVEKIIQYIEVK